MKSSQISPSGITDEELNTLLKQQGLKHAIKRTNNDNKTILQGDLSFDMFPSGIGVHCSNNIEKESACSTSEIAPCLSINILLEGKIRFELGNNSYEFESQDRDNGSCLFINVISQNEIFSRHISKNQKVKKVNITIEKKWLEARYHRYSDSMEVANLFKSDSVVVSLRCSLELTQLALQLMQLKSDKTVAGQLQAEQTTMNIIAFCLPQLLKEERNPKAKHQRHLPSNLPNSNKIDTNNSIHMHQQSSPFIKALNELVFTSMSLSEIALHLGISISTLQRKVKAKYQVSAIEYIRNIRLEKAKTSLVIDGISIGEIAYISGYKHTANFITAFKKRYDITPDQFRQKHNNFTTI